MKVRGARRSRAMRLCVMAQHAQMAVTAASRYPRKLLYHLLPWYALVWIAVDWVLPRRWRGQYVIAHLSIIVTGLLFGLAMRDHQVQIWIDREVELFWRRWHW